MGELVNLPGPRSHWFADSRGRSLKATWHAEAGMIVLSLWESEHCIGTFRLPAADAPRLMTVLANAVKGRVSGGSPDPIVTPDTSQARG
jgi:hypothetical protein